MKRYPKLSFGSPEPKSVARASTFNRTTAKELFENLREVEVVFNNYLLFQ